MGKNPIVGIFLMLTASLVFSSTLAIAHGQQVTFEGAKNMKVIKSGQDVYSVFEAINTTSKKQDIWLSASHDNGKHYNVTNLSNGQVRVKLNETSKPVDNSSNPQIAMDKQGGIYVAWNAKGAGNPSYVVLAISEDKFKTPIIPLVNMTDKLIPGYEPTLINDQENGDVNLYYIMRDQGTGDPCKTRCS